MLSANFTAELNQNWKPGLEIFVASQGRTEIDGCCKIQQLASGGGENTVNSCERMVTVNNANGFAKSMLWRGAI